jgi:hypothetical protein
MYGKHMALPLAFAPLLTRIEILGSRYGTSRVFFDFLECSAIAISNKVDPTRAPQREARYLSIINTYQTLEDRQMLPAMLAELVDALGRTGSDVLGPISAVIGLASLRLKQVWSPFDLCLIMAQQKLAQDRDQIAATIRSREFLSLREPACGPGTMILAFAQAFAEIGYDPHVQLHYEAFDLAPWCVHMTYIQASLMGIPAAVMLGDSRSGVVQEYWYTPMHILGGWPTL